MTKKTRIVYAYLVLLAFTLGFSFTLASLTQAEPDPPLCCVVSWCPRYEGIFERQQGHIEYWEGYYQCIYNPPNECDFWFQCPERP